MLLFCPRGHEQTGQAAMGGICPICIKEDPEHFECKDNACPDVSKGQHFHPTEESYFTDIDGNKYGSA